MKQQRRASCFFFFYSGVGDTRLTLRGPRDGTISIPLEYKTNCRYLVSTDLSGKVVPAYTRPVVFRPAVSTYIGEIVFIVVCFFSPNLAAPLACGLLKHNISPNRRVDVVGVGGGSDEQILRHVATKCAPEKDIYVSIFRFRTRFGCVFVRISKSCPEDLDDIMANHVSYTMLCLRGTSIRNPLKDIVSCRSVWYISSVGTR